MLAYMKKADNGMAKTSIRLRRPLWRAAHIRALDEGRDLQDVIAAALELYLKNTKPAAKGADT
jgi:hypothetical protein